MADAPACPRGEAFYACRSNGFRGCCAADPCALPGCPDGASSAARRPRASSTTLTDSGITHTVPNHSVVTVTRHTVVFSAAPPPAPSSPADASATPPTAAPPASPTAASSGPPRATETHGAGDGTGDGEHATAMSSGAVVGIVVGGLLVGVVVIALLVAWRRRRLGHARPEPDFFAFDDNVGGAGEKTDGHGHHPAYHHQPEPLSAHSTSSDPFAPFGGRADRPQDPYAAPAGAFEMDGTGIAPAELPVDPVDPPAAAAMQPYRAAACVPVPETPVTDPRANLSGLKTDSGHAAYVNHWNQWRALGSGVDHQQ